MRNVARIRIIEQEFFSDVLMRRRICAVRLHGEELDCDTAE
jgi:hypothetical protein